MKQTTFINLCLGAMVLVVGILAFCRLMVNNPEPRPSLTAGQAGVAIPTPALDPGDEIDQKYAERLFDIRFAIASRREGRPDDFTSAPIKELERKRDALLAEIDAEKEKIRKGKLGQKPASAETEPKR